MLQILKKFNIINNKTEFEKPASKKKTLKHKNLNFSKYNSYLCFNAFFLHAIENITLIYEN